MDNATIHKYKPWLLIFQFIGVRIIKLPPYSPFLNIIELFFNMVKQLLQRNHFITKQIHISAQFWQLNIYEILI